jgi:hypothetical protein
MHKTPIFVGMCLILTVSWFPGPQRAHAQLEWTITQQRDLHATPLDVAPSADGQWLYILTPGEILAYSVAKHTVLHRIPVDQAFDRLAYSAPRNSLVVASTASQALQMIQLEFRQDIDISGLPVQGAPAAPVTVVVFNDYQ